MTNREELSRVLGELHGLTIEIVSNPIGSIIRVEMGPLEIPSDEPDASPRGLRRLTILSPWRLQSPDEVICDWTDPGGSGGQLRELLSVLQGQTVESAAAPGPEDPLAQCGVKSLRQGLSFNFDTFRPLVAEPGDAARCPLHA